MAPLSAKGEVSYYQLQVSHLAYLQKQGMPPQTLMNRGSAIPSYLTYLILVENIKSYKGNAILYKCNISPNC
jgi:hypothetical protein